MSSARALRLLVSGYGVLIVLGTALLWLPGATHVADSSWFTAFFTAVSAVCLVGLTLVETATYFTPLGQGIVLLLIQASGLFYLFFALRLARQLRRWSGEAAHAESMTTSSILRRILVVAALVEGGAFLLIYYSWGNYAFESVSQKVGVTLFHAVSAFCNAGFSNLAGNLYTLPRAFILHLAVMMTFLLGGLGIDTLYDLFARPRLRQRMARPETDWRPDTKISVNMTIPLLGLGMGAIYLLEQNNALTDDLNLTEKLVGSLFQSATARTAGFYTINILQLATPTLLVIMVLMLVGGGLGSTAGGIKTGTLYDSVAPDRASTGRKQLAHWVIGYALVVNLLGLAVLYFTEAGAAVPALLFQQVAAFSSVGLSHLPAQEFSGAGQGVLVVSMLLGRIGLLALAMWRTLLNDTAGTGHRSATEVLP